jgi:HPt (histidine-containing phosphotransfer) domain-containing protein
VFASLRALREPGEPDPAAELIDLFLADTPPRLQTLESAVREGRAPLVREVAHSLKGTARNLGAAPLAALCAELEAGAKAGDLVAAPGLFASLAEEYGRVCFVLEQERQKEKSDPPRKEPDAA